MARNKLEVKMKKEKIITTEKVELSKRKGPIFSVDLTPEDDEGLTEKEKYQKRMKRLDANARKVGYKDYQDQLDQHNESQKKQKERKEAQDKRRSELYEGNKRNDEIEKLKETIEKLREFWEKYRIETEQWI